jgi:hypothetical protein
MREARQTAGVKKGEKRMDFVVDLLALYMLRAEGNRSYLCSSHKNERKL